MKVHSNDYLNPGYCKFHLIFVAPYLYKECKFCLQISIVSDSLCVVRKCYKLVEFENMVHYMNMQAEKILEKFFRLDMNRIVRHLLEVVFIMGKTVGKVTTPMAF